MKIQQFEDKGLAHFSYAILSECQKEIVLLDPARDPQPYYDFAAQHGARIVGVIETHPHADFVSSHLEIHATTGATVYVHSLVGAAYPHVAFDHGQVLSLGKIRLKALHTPGHSPDSICVLLEHKGKDKAVFTGDTLFIGDVGRPDLREKAGHLTAQREELARHMYHSTREILMQLPDDVVVYPAHGAGTLCGKALRAANSSTIGQEKQTNPALQPMTEEQFVQYLTADQPFIPKYFGWNVALNKQGAAPYQKSLQAVPLLQDNFLPEPGALVIDTRPQAEFKKGHIPGAFNLQNGTAFETWLGSILHPEEKFYLIAPDAATLQNLMYKAAKIGYEQQITGAFVQTLSGPSVSPVLSIDQLKQHPEQFTIVDIRNPSEVQAKTYFKNALPIPLPELRERAHEADTGKPVAVHCAGGYRSAAGSSIIQAALPHALVLDISEDIQQLNPL